MSPEPTRWPPFWTSSRSSGFAPRIWGGFRQWKYALDVLADRNVWMDTSSCMQEIDDDTLRAILRRHPRERLVFGTDYPIMDPQDEIDALQRRTRFTDSELDELLMNGSAMLFG